MKQVSTITALGALLVVAGAVAKADEQPRAISLPEIESAASDEHGRITVNGKPYFPILMYDVPVDDDSLKMFREQGFNVLSARVEDATQLRKQGFYAAAHAASTAGLKLDGVLFGVGMDSPALNWKDDFLGKSQADLLNMQAMFPKRPIFHAIGYWEDEPEGVFTNKLPSPQSYEELVKVLDVSAPYLYPIPYQSVRSVGEAVARANTATAGRKPLLPILQLFAWKPEDRYPTPAELKCMAYLSLIHGADGIGYYSYNHVTGKERTNIAREQPDLWSAVKQINAEVQQIGKFLLASTPDAGVKVTSRESVVAWRAAKSEDSILLLLTNPTSEPQQLKLQWTSQPTTLRRLDRGIEQRVAKGVSEFTLAPHEVLGLQGVQ